MAWVGRSFTYFTGFNTTLVQQKLHKMIGSRNGWLWIILLGCLPLTMFAQGTSVKTELPKGWHLLDKEKDGYYGISVIKAYEFAKLKKLKSKTILVAVID